MVGGKVINIVRLPDCTWVQCADTTVYYNNQARRIG
jgi:hypothetical protein